MASDKLPSSFVARLKGITAKRPRTVIEHILKHGYITTEELKEKYGYNHPPRAVRDVRECGIPIETFRAKGSDGRSIAAYRFGDPGAVRDGLSGGRNAFSKDFKRRLLESNGERCHICQAKYEERYLQIDHRVPYEVGGDVRPGERDIGSYMLLCSSCNRAKSWSCEHCRNWAELKSGDICGSCYWASPESYTSIAMQEARRLDLTWLGDETEVYENVKTQAQRAKETMPKFVKKILEQVAKKG